MKNEDFKNFIKKCIPYVHELGITFKLDFVGVQYLAQETKKEETFKDFLNYIYKKIKEKEDSMSFVRRSYYCKDVNVKDTILYTTIGLINVEKYIYLSDYDKIDIFREVIKESVELSDSYGYTDIFLNSIYNQLQEIKEMNDFIREIIRNQLVLWNEFLSINKKDSKIKFNSAYYHSKGVIVKPMSITESNEGKFVICSISGEGIKKGNIVIEYNSFFDLCTEV